MKAGTAYYYFSICSIIFRSLGLKQGMGEMS